MIKRSNNSNSPQQLFCSECIPAIHIPHSLYQVPSTKHMPPYPKKQHAGIGIAMTTHITMAKLYETLQQS